MVFNRKPKSNANLLFYQIDLFIEKAPFRNKGMEKEIGLRINTIRNYKSLKRLVIAYENYSSSSIILEEVNKSFVESFTKWMLDHKGYSVNYTANIIRLLKAICSEAEKNGIKVHYYAKFISSFNQARSDRYLQIISFEEIQKIKNAQNLTYREKNAQAWILIGLYLGQRVSDLLSISPGNVRASKNGGVYVDVLQKKTGRSVTIGVIDPYVVNLLREKFPTPIYAQKFNYLMKQVCEKAGLNDVVKGYKLSKSPKRKVFGEYYKWEIIAAHDLRRSFATNYFGKIETPLLMHITGHTKETTFLKYIGRNQNRDSFADAFMEKARFIE